MERGSLLLGIDLGTSFAKGVVCTPEGDVLASHVIPTGLHGSVPGAMEQDPEATWWKAGTEICRALLSGAVRAEDIGAVGACGLFPSFVGLDDRGRALTPGVLYFDGRGGSELGELFPGRDLGAPSLFAQSLAWLRERRSSLFERLRMVLPAAGYLVFRLTGETVIDRTLAADVVLMPPGSETWEREACDVLGFPRERLPRVARSFDVAGTVSVDAARATGLRTGTPVIVGTGDIAAEAVSAGIWEAGRALLVYGSTACLVLTMADPAEPCRGLGLCPHCFPGVSLRVGATATSGSALDWLIDVLFAVPPLTSRGGGGDPYGDRPSRYAALNTGAAALPRGSGGVMVFPYLKGARAPMRDRAVRGVMLGITLSTSREEIYRAFLEGIAYDVRSIMDAARDRCEVPPFITATGGASANTLLARIMSDVLRREQRMVRDSSAARGAAFLAGLGTGLVAGARVAAERWARDGGPPVIPDPAASSVYDGFYGMWGSLQQTMRRATSDLGALAEGSPRRDDGSAG